MSDENVVLEEAKKQQHEILDSIQVLTFGTKPEEKEYNDNDERLSVEKGPSGSKQIKQDFSDTSNVGTTVFHQHKVRQPKFDPEQMADFTLINSRLSKSINVMAKNTVGLGWEIVDVFSEEERKELDDATKEKIKEQKKNLKDRLNSINKEKPFEDVMFLIKQDEESTGDAFLEVIRNNDNDIVELEELPSKTMRVRKDREGFVQIKGDKVRFFIPFGSDESIDPVTGQEMGGDPLISSVATEVIHFRIEHPCDDFYGVPRWVPCIASIIGSRKSDLRNVAFMENDAVPRMVIVVSGGNLDNESINSIKEFMNLEGKDVTNAHRTMLLQPERRTQGPVGNDPPKIDVVPLTVGIKDDASFLKYRSANNDEIKEVFGFSDLFYGMSRDINRAAAAVAKQVTNEQEFIPERRRIEHIINHKLLPGFSFETDLVRLRFKAPIINDLSELGDSISKVSSAGGLSPNEIKELLNKEPFQKDENFNPDLPGPFALELFRTKMKLLLAEKEAELQSNNQDSSGNSDEDGSE